MSSPIESLQQHVINHLGVGLALHPAHALTNKKAQQLGFSAAIGSKLARVGIKNFLNHGFNSTCPALA